MSTYHALCFISFIKLHIFPLSLKCSPTMLDQAISSSTTFFQETLLEREREFRIIKFDKSSLCLSYRLSKIITERTENQYFFQWILPNYIFFNIFKVASCYLSGCTPHDYTSEKILQLLTNTNNIVLNNSTKPKHQNADFIQREAEKMRALIQWKKELAVHVTRLEGWA